MADFWGLDAIARRLDISRPTLRKMYAEQRFAMFKRWKSLPRGSKPRLLWYTNDELITRWELAQCSLQHKQASAARRPSKPSPDVDAERKGVKA